jgi:hypothetical protein
MLQLDPVLPGAFSSDSSTMELLPLELLGQANETMLCFKN